MNFNHMPFMNAMQQLRGDIVTRQKIAAVAIGYAVACNTPLPTSEVVSATDHYISNGQPLVRRILSELNECVVYDLPMAQEFARNFWLMRYEAVHKCPRMDQVPGNFFCSVFGVPKFFAQESIDLCNEHAASINIVYQAVCTSIEKMFSEDV